MIKNNRILESSNGGMQSPQNPPAATPREFTRDFKKLYNMGKTPHLTAPSEVTRNFKKLYNQYNKKWLII